MSRILKVTAITLLATAALAETAIGQITAPRMQSAPPDRFDRLEDQLINRLRATTESQQAYLKFLMMQVREGRLDAALVVAIQRRAQRRNGQIPFPYFERVMRGEAFKRRIELPPAQSFVSTRDPVSRQR